MLEGLTDEEEEEEKEENKSIIRYESDYTSACKWYVSALGDGRFVYQIQQSNLVWGNLQYTQKFYTL